MKKLWSASNVKVYGGGVGEAAFLDDLSKLIGDFDRNAKSVSSSKDGRGVTHQLQRERIYEVSDLASMPKGRAVVLASGARPALVRTQPWMTSRYAADVRASIAAHDPHAEHTIREAQREAEAVAAAEGDQPTGKAAAR